MRLSAARLIEFSSLPHHIRTKSSPAARRSFASRVTASDMQAAAMGQDPVKGGPGGPGTMGLKEEKQDARTAIKAALKMLTSEQMQSESKAICDALLSSPIFLTAHRLGIYLHCERLKEVDTSALVEAGIAAGKRCYVPVVEDKNSNMLLLHLDDMADVVSVPPFGILEPPKVYASGESRQDALKEAASAPLDVLLMPGLGFDRSGRRLGRGGGYYDKMVQQLRSAATSHGWAAPLLVALAFNAQVMPSIPVDPHDELVDVLVTSTGSGLRLALKSRSFKKEIILLVAHTGSTLPLVHTAMALRSLGMEHVLILGADARVCEQQIRPLLPKYGCAWDSFHLSPTGISLEGASQARSLQTSRFRTLARSVRLGYNVLYSDTDVLFFTDPYKYLKSPPFNEYVIISQPHIVWTEDEYHNASVPNVGFLYIQNASESGPASWMLSEVSNRLYRWMDTKFSSLTALGGHATCMYSDEDLLTDALGSVRSGSLLFQHSIMKCAGTDAREKLKDALDAKLQGTIQDTEVQLPTWMASVNGGQDHIKLRFVNMLLPHMGPQWEGSLGGNMYGGAPGGLSNKWMALLQEDCPKCNTWPDPEGAQSQEGARQVVQEKLLWAPPFLVSGYSPRGRLGYWTPELLGGRPPQQVVGHIHNIPGAQSSLIPRSLAKMSLGMYEWEAAHETQGPHIYHMSMKTNGGIRESAVHGEVVPRLLLLHPHIRLDLLNNVKEYQELVIGMHQVAEATGRGVVFPDLPCDLPWLDKEPASGATDHVAAPLRLHQHVLPRVHRAPSGSWAKSCPVGFRNDSQAGKAVALRCTWVFTAYADCLKQGMFEVEFDHAVEKYKLQLDLQPGPHNTFLEPAQPEPGSSPASQILVLRREDVQSAAAAFNDQRVLYLGHPVQFEVEKRKLLDCGDRESSSSCCRAFSRSSLGAILNSWPSTSFQGGQITRRPGLVNGNNVQQADSDNSPTKEFLETQAAKRSLVRSFSVPVKVARGPQPGPGFREGRRLISQ